MADRSRNCRIVAISLSHGRGAPLSIRLAIRTLGRAPWYATASIRTLALAIAPWPRRSTAIVNGVLFKPLPYPTADRPLHVRGFGRPGRRHDITGAGRRRATFGTRMREIAVMAHVARGLRHASRPRDDLVGRRGAGCDVPLKLPLEQPLLRKRVMARALWTGSLSFGLVSIPVEIHTAVRDKGPRFRLLRRTDRSPIKFQRVAQRDGEVVEWEQIVKGYEYAKGQFIVLTSEDFEKAALKKDRVIDISDFVAGDDIDDRFFEKPYYLLPGKGGAKAYALLRDAIKASGRIGIAKFVLRTKQRLAAIEAIGDALVLSTMRFRDELARLDEFEFPASVKVPARELQMAQKLIDAFSADWEPEKYTDDYRHNIMKVVEAKKARAKPEFVEETDPQSAQVIDLMERLRKSLGTSRAHTAKAAKAPRTQKKTRKRAAKKSNRRAA